MLDIDIFRALSLALTKGMLDFYNIEIRCIQGHNRKQVGRPSGKCLIIDKISDQRYGWIETYEYYKTPDNVTYRQEYQPVFSTFQINALWATNDNSQYTASDLANMAAMLMQSENVLPELREKGIYTTRVLNVENPYYENDSMNFEAMPFFRIEIQHTDVLKTIIPAASVTGEIKEIQEILKETL